MPCLRPGLAISLGCLIFCLAAAASTAQDWSRTGRLDGVIKDESGQPVVGARVKLSTADQPSAGPPWIEASESGRWSYLGLAGGSWRVLVEAPGHQSSGHTVVVEPFGIGTTLDVILSAVSEEELRELTDAETLLRIQAADLKLLGGRFVEAREAYEEVIVDLEPGERAQVLLQIAKTHKGEGNPNEGIASLERALEDDPEHVESLEHISNLLIAQGREAEAQAYMSRLPETTTLEANAYLNVGIHHYNAGDLEAAKELFERVVTAYPESADGYFYRGLILLSQGESELSAADFVQALQLEPRGRHAPEARKFLEYLE